MDKKKYEYASAPYNFIPFPEKVVYRHSIFECDRNNIIQGYDIDVLPSHDRFEANLKTGYIEYMIDVKTPLFISNGKREFFSVNGEYVIPGSTVRGKVRSNAEVLSWSNPEFIKDGKLWYRGAFSGDVLKKMYEEFLFPNENSKINDKVKAGYLINKYGEYKIIPAKEDAYQKSFKPVHEKNLVKQCKKMVINNEIHFMYSLEYEENKLNPQKDSWNRFDELKHNKKLLKDKLKIIIGNKKEEDLTKDEKRIKDVMEKQIKGIKEGIKDLLINNENNNYKPYYCNISYNIDENNEIKIKHLKKFTMDKFCGVLMNSSKMGKNNKQNHYVIYPPDLDKEAKLVDRKLKNSFETNVKYMQRKISNLFHLPKENECIPIFYILNNDNKVESFGFTPYLKIAYEKSVLEGIDIKKEYEYKLLDYVQSIFGFTNFQYENGENIKQFSYRGRVSFTNVKLIGDKENLFEKELNKSLMSPKISSFQLYLKQHNIEDFDLKKVNLTLEKYDYNLKKYKMNLKTYSGNFKLRGQKFYWLKNESDNFDDYEKEKIKNQNNHKNPPKKEQFASLKAVKREEKFKGRIYYENLTEDELGLLILSIKPFDEAMDNLGQGKPYGFGKVKFNITGIKEINIKDRFNKFNICKNNYSEFTDRGIKNCKNAFKNFMKKQEVEFNFFENIRLKCFYISKYQEQNINNKEFTYMELKDKGKRFTNRNVLKSMDDYIKENYETILNAQKYIADDKEENQEEYLEKILSSKFFVSKRKSKK